MNKLRNRTGPPVEGNDFYGREKEIAYVWKQINKGNNVMLPAPRRVGKTSFAKKMLEKAKTAGWDTLEINLEASHTEMDFVKLFVEGLKQFSFWEKMKDKGENLLKILKSIKPKVKMGPAEFELEWSGQKSDVYQQLDKLLDHDKPTLIFFDELTVLLDALIREENGAETVAHFLHWLRSVRQVSGSKIRWIFCSSVGIENFTFFHRLSKTTNDIPSYRLKSFDKPTATGLIIALEQDAGISLPPLLREKILNKIAYLLPYFIQIVFEKIASLHETENMEINEQLVDKAYQTVIEESYLNTWTERLYQQYEKQQAHAFFLLKLLCQRKDGLNRNHLL